MIPDFLGLAPSPSESSSVSQSVSLSVTKVLIFPAISFFWFSGMFWGSISEEKWRSPIFRENPHFSKIGQKGPKNEVFGTYEKNFALVLSGNGLKRKNRSNLNFCRKPHVKKNFFGQDMAENGHFCGARNFFFRKIIFLFKKIFFAQFSKLSHFEHKYAKKNFQAESPL